VSLAEHPVLDGIPFLRAGRDALAAEALFAQPAPAGGHAEAGHAAGPRARPVH